MSQNPFARTLLWVLRVKECGGPQVVVATAKMLGAGLIVKWHDGDPSDDAKYGFQEQFRACLKIAQAEGVPMLSWGYCYGDKYGNLIREADAVVKSLKEGAEGYVIDAEGEWEAVDEDSEKPLGPDWARRFIDRIWSQIPGAKQRLAYAPFWNTRYHKNYPAREFSFGCSAVMPQVYYALAERKPDQVAAMWRVTREDYEPLGLPVYPVGEFPGATVDHVRAFLAAIGDKPHSWWLLDKATPKLLDAAFPRYVTYEEYLRVKEEAAELRTRLDRIRDLASGPTKTD